MAPLFADDARATILNPRKLKGRKGRLALTDPDSIAVVPASVFGFGGDFVLSSQGDQQLSSCHIRAPKRIADGPGPEPVSRRPRLGDKPAGHILTTDSSADAIVAITAGSRPGTAYAATTPCNANSAPATCTAPNYFGTINPKSGAVTAKAVGGVAFQPKGMVYLP